MGSSFNDEIVDTTAEIGSTGSADSRDEASQNSNNETDAQSEHTDQSDTESIQSTEPPKLKYSRLNKLPARFFNRDAVSCCYFHEEVFIFATHSGFIHLTRPDFSAIRTMKIQRSSILSLHTDGEYFAAGSIDGTVVIGSIVDEKDIIAYDFKRPIHAVALDKNYKSTKLFISGGTSGNVVFSARNWLGQRQDTVVEGGKGPITLIKTIDDLVIWTNDTGITVAQISSRTIIFHEKLPENFPRPEMYWPRFHQTDTDRFLIGWVDHIWTFRVSITSSNSSIISSAASSFRYQPDKKIALEHHILMEDTLIAGVCDFGDDLMILNYVKNSEPPELKIVDRTSFEEYSVDQVALNQKSNLGLNDFHLYQHGTRWFLVSADDCVIVQQYGIEDQLKWYTLRGEYLEAWKMSGLWLDKQERLNIGERQMKKLVAENDWQAASSFLSEMLATTGTEDPEYLESVVKSWDHWVTQFFKENKETLVLDVIPSTPIGDLFVSPEHYNHIFDYLIKNNEFEQVLRLAHKWDHALFDVESLRDKLEDDLENSRTHETEIRQLIVQLSLELDEMEKCVDHLIWLKDPDIMLFLDEHHLLLPNLKRLPEILSLSASGKPLDSESLSVPVAILVENSHEILPQEIVEILDSSGMDYVSFLYLDALSAHDKLLVKDFQDEMVKLYASYNRDNLLNFLSRHYNYSVEKAISICEDKNCISELVYLLSKVGENKKALKLIVDELKDPERAIKFVSESDDRELWDFLLDYSMDRPAFVQTLVIAASDLVDPIPVISRIPNQVEITGLHDALLQICGNTEMDRLLHQLILKIISSETMGLTHEYMGLRAKGTVFELDSLPEETLIHKSNKLMTEKEFLGISWKGSAATITEKLNHLAYIRRQTGR
ncbi:hypothetical protein OGAPHI_005318 [Ogataea philodendri]|uniref:Vps41 beta-propeller domain-containing protein n=1 Tax=Ogataea philodendri TaxID=1378263 RepID=A0A9P8P0J8_9ASCO|nr:uncharacterized protein OGAPHI_005318 [Ogataea philodendri]KAH3663328.1 hypothetical protein OGAPHI_005318 [Ogataea philodendri]